MSTVAWAFMLGTAVFDVTRKSAVITTGLRGHAAVNPRQRVVAHGADRGALQSAARVQQDDGHHVYADDGEHIQNGIDDHVAGL